MRMWIVVQYCDHNILFLFIKAAVSSDIRFTFQEIYVVIEMISGMF